MSYKHFLSPTPQKVLSHWKLVVLKMIDFSDQS